MAAQDLTLMQAMLRKMDWLEARQKTLAQNIANADTPGYQPRDIAPMDFSRLMDASSSKVSLKSSTGLATTNTGHISSGGSFEDKADAPEKKQKKPYETAPAGNAVVLEEQLLKMNETATDHGLISNLYQKNMDMLKSSVK